MGTRPKYETAMTHDGLQAAGQALWRRRVSSSSTQHCFPSSVRVTDMTSLSDKMMLQQGVQWSCTYSTQLTLELCKHSDFFGVRIARVFECACVKFLNGFWCFAYLNGFDVHVLQTLVPYTDSNKWLSRANRITENIKHITLHSLRSSISIPQIQQYSKTKFWSVKTLGTIILYYEPVLCNLCKHQFGILRTVTKTYLLDNFSQCRISANIQSCWGTK
jgi:hypothetical protein